MMTLDQDDVRRALRASKDEITDEQVETLRAAAAGYLAHEAALRTGVNELRAYAAEHGVPVSSQEREAIRSLRWLASRDLQA